MKKLYFLVFSLLLLTGYSAQSQCTNASAFGSVAAPTTAVPVTISTCSFQQEYSTITSVIAGNRYVLTVSAAGSFITVHYNTPAGTVVAMGVTPLQFTAPCNGTYYAHWNTNSACGTAAVCVTTTVACSSCGAAASQCTSGSAFASVAAPTTINVPLTITTCSFQSEHATITSVVANRVYVMDASIAGTFITMHQGTPAGPVIASGVTPLAFTSTVGGTYYAEWNTNSACGTGSTCMTTTITYIGDPVCVGAPANDNCSNATLIACGGSASGSTASATLDGPATSCTGGNVAPDVWYTVVGTGGSITASLCGSSYDTKIDIYSGTCGALTSVACNDDFAGCGLQSQISWASVLSTTYYIRVHGFGGAVGAYTLNVTCAPLIPNDVCTGAININCGQTIVGNTSTATPDAVANCNGVNLSGAPGLWYTFVGNGANNTLSLCGSGYDTEIGVFSGTCGSLVCVTANDDFCGLQSQVTFATTANTRYYVLVTGFSTASGAFTLTRTSDPAPNDVCTGAFTINCGQTITGSTTCGATLDAVPTCGTSLNTAPGLWYTFVGDGTANTLSLCGSGYDTKIGVFTGTCGALTCVTGNDDFCGTRSQVTIPAFSGTTYYVLVTGFGTASGSFSLTRTCGAPINDFCSAAININCGQTITGSTALCTSDAVPTCTTSLNTAPGIWYQFVGDGSPVTMSLCGSAYDTKIGIFTGTCGVLTCVIGNDDFCGLQSQVTFNTNAAVTYYVLVTGFNTASGNFTLVRTCAPPCAGVPSPGAVTPVTTTTCVGNNVTLTCSGYSANSALTFQWSSGPAAVGPYTNIVGATSNIYTFAAPAATTYYRCTVTCTNGGGNGTTAPVVVNVSNIQFTATAATPNTVCSPGTVTITGTVTGGLNLGNYSFTLTGAGTIGAPVYSGANNSSVSFSVTNIPAGTPQVYTLTATDPVPCSKSTTINVTVNLTPVVTLVPASATICNGAIQPITANVTTGSGTVVFSPLTELYTDAGATVAYTGTALASGTTIYAKPTVTRTYTATVTSAQSCSSSTPITITVNQLPAITVQPVALAAPICPGFNVTYTVTATGAGLTYQWRRNGVNLVNGALINLSTISGATTNALTITNVGAANAGNYDVVVSGTCPPPATSNPVALVVASAPVISTQPANLTVCANTSAVFTVATVGSVPSPTIYQWQVSTDGGATWTNLTTGGSYTATFTIAAALITQNNNRYRVIVTNNCGQSITSGAAILTVNVIPVVVATDLFTQRICISDTLVPLVGTPAGGTWTGIGVSGSNFIPPITAVGTFVLTYTFTNSFGCTISDTTTVRVSDCPERERLLKNDAVLLFPNPNNGHFNFQMKSTLYNYLGLKVYDMNGRLLTGKFVTNSATGHEIQTDPTYNGLVYGRVVPVDLSQLPSGTYLVEVYYDDGVRTSRKGILVVIMK
jgi:Secretion system C-terminal sorting domain